MIVPKRASFFTFLYRSFSSSTSTSTSTSISITKKLPKLRCLNSIPTMYKSRVIEEAQKALTDYFHASKSLPFVFAELIANNSPFSLSKLLRKVHFSAPKFSNNFTKLLRYEPINDFEFFLESIGIDYEHVLRLLPPDKFFFAEDRAVLDAASLLSRFGFPWNRLGTLYVDEVSVFSRCSDELTDRLNLLKERCGFDNLGVVGLCLAFPRLLSLEGEFGSHEEAIIDDLKRVYREFDKGSCVEGNVDSWYELCCKVRIFYGLGIKKGTVGELMCLGKDVVFSCPRGVLARKVDYFSRFGGRKVDVGSWILQSPEILNLDVETRVMSVFGLLVHFGLDAVELQLVERKYPHVFGRNKIANLPYVTKALDLHEWCFDKIKSSNGQLLASYAIRYPEEDVDKMYVGALKKIESSVYASHTMSKVDFLNRIGFGENVMTLKVLKLLHGNSTKLLRRFDCLLRLGFKHSRLCLMIRSSTNILCMSPKSLEEKADFVRQETGSLEYIYDFPYILCYEFENRIRRRHKFYVWLRDTGLLTKKYSIATALSTSENRFIGRVFDIHPAAPKRYLEFFSYKNITNDYQD